MRRWDLDPLRLTCCWAHRFGQIVKRFLGPQHAEFDATQWTSSIQLERLPLVGSIISSTGNRLFAPNVMFGDIVEGLPVADGAANIVYSSHVLEHLPRDDVTLTLANVMKVLKPGGTFRLMVPDLSWRVQEYLRLSSEKQSYAADSLFKSCMIGQETRPHGLMSMARHA